MPYDIRSIPGKRKYIEPTEQWPEGLVKLVRETWPGAMCQGGVGSYCLTVGDTVVAEAWIHPTRPGWWLRILPTTAPKAQ